MSENDLLITEEWLGEVGFKYREPGERQIFKHWTLKFNEPTDYGLYLETTMGGVINRTRAHSWARCPHQSPCLTVKRPSILSH